MDGQVRVTDDNYYTFDSTVKCFQIISAAVKLLHIIVKRTINYV